ncbi:TonB-dependent receptor plug domain-containing protein, partial [Klebsiella pneumoniae]|nr:TonB-dependent receptor plug domain-containing protein [Klebsiella pneumoniae]
MPGKRSYAFATTARDSPPDRRNLTFGRTRAGGPPAAAGTLQAPGVSTITADEIRKRPPARDVSEIIRTMPGVNLTGNSTSGQRGNNRQIDIRGMGPEKTRTRPDGNPGTGRDPVPPGGRGG